MTKVLAGMTMSLDGFVADAHGSAGALYPDYDELGDTAWMLESIARTGAVLMGRRTFEMGHPDSYVGSYEFQVPIVVLTSSPPEDQPKQDDRLSFAFVTEGGAPAAVARAKVAAQGRDVTVVGGPALIVELLELGLLDELSVDVMPVVLGKGLRLFDGATPRRLTKTDVSEIGMRTCLRFSL